MTGLGWYYFLYAICIHTRLIQIYMTFICNICMYRSNAQIHVHSIHTLMFNTKVTYMYLYAIYVLIHGINAHMAKLNM